MKRAVSISLGSSRRDHKVTINLLGQEVSVERIGTDGNVQRAMALYEELDGQVDTFGVGGTDLGLQVEDRYYPLHAAQKMVSGVKKTPLVDGGNVRSVLERQRCLAWAFPLPSKDCPICNEWPACSCR